MNCGGVLGFAGRLYNSLELGNCYIKTVLRNKTKQSGKAQILEKALPKQRLNFYKTI